VAYRLAQPAGAGVLQYGNLVHVDNNATRATRPGWCTFESGTRLRTGYHSAATWDRGPSTPRNGPAARGVRSLLTSSPRSPHPLPVPASSATTTRHCLARSLRRSLRHLLSRLQRRQRLLLLRRQAEGVGVRGCRRPPVQSGDLATDCDLWGPDGGFTSATGSMAGTCTASGRISASRTGRRRRIRQLLMVKKLLAECFDKGAPPMSWPAAGTSVHAVRQEAQFAWREKESRPFRH